MLSIIGALVVGKFAAAEITGRMYGYTRDERLTIWSLTLPQVAATLAATLVAYRTVDRAGSHLLDDRMLNVVLALMLEHLDSRPRADGALRAAPAKGEGDAERRARSSRDSAA